MAGKEIRERFGAATSVVVFDAERRFIVVPVRDTGDLSEDDERPDVLARGKVIERREGKGDSLV